MIWFLGVFFGASTHQPGSLKSMRIVDCFPLKRHNKITSSWRNNLPNNLPIHEIKLLPPYLLLSFWLTSSWPEVGHNSSETWPSRLWAFEVKSWIPFELRGRNHEDWRWQSDRFLLCLRWDGFFWYRKEGYPGIQIPSLFFFSEKSLVNMGV